MGNIAVDKTIPRLIETLKHMANQDVGKEDQKTFLDNLSDGGYDDLDGLVDDLFDTEDLNTDWVELAYGDGDGDEAGEGVRKRASIAFLCSWKKSILNACSKSTDVDKLFRCEVGGINNGIVSLDVTRSVLSPPEAS